MDMLGQGSFNREVVLSLKSECLEPQTVSFTKRVNFSIRPLFRVEFILAYVLQAKMCEKTCFPF